MTEFLVRRFVKNYEQTETVAVRTAYGVLASVVGILCNVFLFLVKGAVGIILHSISVTADAFNNLSDAGSSIIGLVGVKMAEKPADEEHPFGHGRIEYIAALVVAFIVLQVGFTFLKDAVGRIRNPEILSFNTISVVILILSIGVKLWMAAFNRKLGKRIDSKVMMATAADAMGDVATTTATILSVLFFRVTGINIDGFVGIGVALVVMWAGIGIAKEDQDRIFERFYRVDKSHSRETGGTGLGLSIVKHGAMMHQAEIRLDSQPGKGTSITLDFPEQTEAAG